VAPAGSGAILDGISEVHFTLGATKNEPTMRYVLDALEGLFGGFIFCFLGFGTGGGLVKAAHDLRIELKREECSIGMCLMSIFFIAFWGLATVFLFGLPVLVALEAGTDVEPLRLAIKGVAYYAAGGFFIWSFVQKIPEVMENK